MKLKTGRLTDLQDFYENRALGISPHRIKILKHRDPEQLSTTHTYNPYKYLFLNLLVTIKSQAKLFPAFKGTCITIILLILFKFILSQCNVFSSLLLYHRLARQLLYRLSHHPSLFQSSPTLTQIKFILNICQENQQFQPQSQKHRKPQPNTIRWLTIQVAHDAMLQ